MAGLGFPRYPCFSFDQVAEIATILVTEDPNFDFPIDPLASTIKLPQTSQRLEALAKMEPVGSKSLTFQVANGFPIFQIPYSGEFVPPGVGFGINDRLLTPFYLEGSVAAGTCETWEVLSDPVDLEHSFHVHLANFLVKAMDGVEVETPLWRDTIKLEKNATIHVCFDRAKPGDMIMAHCHAASHFDVGMAANFNVTEAPTEPISAPAPTSSGGAPAAAPVITTLIFGFACLTLSLMLW